MHQVVLAVSCVLRSCALRYLVGLNGELLVPGADVQRAAQHVDELHLAFSFQWERRHSPLWEK